jgi:putative ABC transport system permease protein
MLSLGLGPTWRALLRHRATYFAVVLQIAIGYAIVVQSVAIARRFVDTARTPTGWDDGRVVVAVTERDEPSLDPRSLRERDRAAMRAIPGVDAVESVTNLPTSRRDLADLVVTDEGTRALFWSLVGGPAYAEVLGGKLLAGRFPTAADIQALEQGAPVPAVLTEPLVRELFGEGDAARVIGREVMLPTRGRPMRILGVIDAALGPPPFVPDPKQVALLAVDPHAGRRHQMLIRVAPGQLSAVLDRVPHALRAVDAARWQEVLPLVAYRDRVVRNAYGAPRIIYTVNAIVIGVVLFGSLGMASFLVSERKRQIGIRRALGARRADVVGYFLVENFLLTTVGLVVGLPLNALLFHVLTSLGNTLTFAPWDYVAAAAIFWAVGLVAALMPALRASRIPPVVASKGAES